MGYIDRKTVFARHSIWYGASYYVLHLLHFPSANAIKHSPLIASSSHPAYQSTRQGTMKMLKLSTRGAFPTLTYVGKKNLKYLWPRHHPARVLQCSRKDRMFPLLFTNANQPIYYWICSLPPAATVIEACNLPRVPRLRTGAKLFLACLLPLHIPQRESAWLGIFQLRHTPCIFCRFHIFLRVLETLPQNVCRNRN